MRMSSIILLYWLRLCVLQRLIQCRWNRLCTSYLLNAPILLRSLQFLLLLPIDQHVQRRTEYAMLLPFWQLQHRSDLCLQQWRLFA